MFAIYAFAFFVFLDSSLNFDKEYWYYMYIEQFLKNNVFRFFFATVL